MLNHVSIGVRDVAKAKRFYDAALKPLGYTCLSESPGSLGYGRDAVALWIGAAERPVPADDKSGLHICLDAPAARAWMRSTRRRCGRADATTASRVSGPTTDPTTTRPSWSIPTAIASKPIAARRAEGRAEDACLREFAAREAPEQIKETDTWLRFARRS